METEERKEEVGRRKNKKMIKSSLSPFFPSDLCGLLGLMKAEARLFFKNLFQVDQKLRNIFLFVFFLFYGQFPAIVQFLSKMLVDCWMRFLEGTQIYKYNFLEGS